MCLIKPVKTAQLEQGQYAGYLDTVADFGVGDVIGPLDIQHASQIMKVYGIETLLLSAVEVLRFIAVK